MRQIVADDVLDDLASRFDDIAVRKDGLQSQHELLGRSVLERARSAGALGDIAADDGRLQRRWIRRIKQPDALDRLLKRAGDHVRLDDRPKYYRHGPFTNPST